MTARPMTTETPEQLAQRVVDTWGEGNPPIVVLARALLSTSSAVRGMRDRAAKVADDLAAELARLQGASDRRVQIGSHLETCATIAAGIRALSLEGEDKQARATPSAPITTDTKDTTK